MNIEFKLLKDLIFHCALLIAISISLYVVTINAYFGISLLGVFFICLHLHIKRHDENIDKTLLDNPCHAVWVGDSYFFYKNEVVDACFSKHNLQEDQNGLFLYRSLDRVSGVSRPEDGSKEYLQPHVQRSYANYKNKLKEDNANC